MSAAREIANLRSIPTNGNILLDYTAGDALDGTGTCNIAAGLNALGAATSGDDNVAIGQLALGAGVTTGAVNIAIGKNAADALTTGYENIAIGFGTRTSRWVDLDKLYVVPRRWPDGIDDTISQDWGSYLMDVMIMHPRKLLDTEHAFKLHEEKKLLPAEVGWWQVLSEPTGGENHISMYGGAQIERFLTRTRYDNQQPRIPT